MTVRITNLVISRKPGEAVLIGDRIRIRVTAIDRWGNMKLLIQAPEDVLILREELRQARADGQEDHPTP